MSNLSFKKSVSRHIAGYLFISPWLIGFLLLALWPILQSLYLSFTQYSLLEAPKWIGLMNYREIFHDQLFYTSLKVTFLFVFISVPLKLAFSLMVAILLNRSIRGINLYRTAFYFPSLIGGSIAVSVLWRNMFGMDGYINQILAMVGIQGMGWISIRDGAWDADSAECMAVRVNHGHFPGRAQADSQRAV